MTLLALAARGPRRASRRRARRHRVRRPRPAPRPRSSISQEQDVTSCCRDGSPPARSATGQHVEPDRQRRREPCRQAGRVDRSSDVGRPARSTSRYSPSDSCPVGRARPKCEPRAGREALGVRDRHLGSPQRPLPDAGHVAVAGPADLAQLRVPQPHLGRHAGTAGVVGPQDERRCTGTSPPRTGPGRCPGCRRPAAPARPRRARARSRCTRRSRSRASSGSPRRRARPGPPASPATGSPCAARPRCGPTAAPRPRCGGGATYQSIDRPSAAIASSHRPRSKCSLHSWNVPPAAPDPLDDPRRCGGRPGWRCPRPATPAGSCHFSCTPRALAVASRSRPILRRSSATVFWPNHWNGVCGLGTKPPTLTPSPTPGWCGACRGRRSSGPARRCRACPRRSRWAGR